MKDSKEKEWEIIDVYSRKQALEEGVQVLANPATSKEVGFKIPVYMTAKVFDKYVKVPEGFEAFQQEDGRLWDVLYMLMFYIKGGNGQEQTLEFKVSVALPDKGDWLPNEKRDRCRTQRLVTLHSIIGSTDFDDPEPCICITLPDED